MKIDAHGALHDRLGQYASDGSATATYDLAGAPAHPRAVDWSDPSDVAHLRGLLKAAASASRSLGRGVGGTDWSADMESSLAEEIVRASAGAGGANKVREITPAWVWAVARNMQSNALEAVRQGRPPEDYMRVNRQTVRAWSALAAARRTFAARTGREMTTSEEDAAATSIRDGFPPGNRPPLGFHRSGVSAKVTRGLTGNEVDANARGMYQDYAPSAESVALAAADSSGEDVTVDPNAKRGKWLLTAKTFDMPFTAAETLTETRARALRTMVGPNAADVMRVVDDWWETGAAQARAAAILTATFGARSASEQRQVVNFLEQHAELAHKFFDAAVTDATIRRVRPTQKERTDDDR